VKQHPATKPPSLIYGNDHDYNKLCVIEYGRTNFDLQTKYSSQEKVDLYCYYNMRQQYCSMMEYFNASFDFFTAAFTDTSNRVSFIDLGGGPLTSGLAFNQTFSSANRFHFHYIGIDVSVAMLSKAREFADAGTFDKDSTFLLKHSLEDIATDYWDSTFCFPNTVVLNFSHQFANMGKEDVEKLATGVNNLLDKYPLNKYIIAATDRKNRMYHIFRRLVPGLRDQI
jgi:hypothetical protein